MTTEGNCQILFHQRPMLQDVTDVTDPLGALFFMSWVTTPDAELDDAALARATVALDGKNLLFLKALVDGQPEIINIELPEGEFARASLLKEAQPVICVHYSNDPASGFYCRQAKEVRILGPIEGWTLRSSEQARGAEQGTAAPAAVQDW